MKHEKPINNQASQNLLGKHGLYSDKTGTDFSEENSKSCEEKSNKKLKK